MRANLIFCCGADGGAEAEKNHSQPQGSHVLLGQAVPAGTPGAAGLSLPFWEWRP